MRVPSVLGLQQVWRAVLLLCVCLCCAAVPTALSPHKPKHSADHPDLITNLPGAPASIDFKQYAGAPGPSAWPCGMVVPYGRRREVCSHLLHKRA